MSIEVTLLFFAKSREIVGKKHSMIILPNNISYKDLLNKISETYALESIKNSVILAINQEFCSVDDSINLKQGDEIAVIPPLSVEAINDLVSSPLCGAISLFVGTTRDNFEGKEVVKLEYEAYESMGIKSMEKLCKEIREKWIDIENIAIYHRLGTVPVKEASIIIAISSPHRQDAIKATEWCIDNVKKSVPIWKKEVYGQNISTWKENKESHFPPKINKFKLDMQQEVEVPNIPSYLIQIKGSSNDINQRIDKFMEMKREEINNANIRDFCQRSDQQINCARIDSVLIKRKDSKGYLQVNKVLNNFSRDQNNQDYLMKYIPKNGIEERVVNLESQLNLTTKIPIEIYKRLKLLEDRVLNLEAVSPEYIQFWDKSGFTQKSSKKKRIFSIHEIDNLISDLEKQKN